MLHAHGVLGSENDTAMPLTSAARTDNSDTAAGRPDCPFDPHPPPHPALTVHADVDHLAGMT